MDQHQDRMDHRCPAKYHLAVRLKIPVSLLLCEYGKINKESGMIPGMNPMGQPGGFNPQMGSYPNMPPFMQNMQPHGFRNSFYYYHLAEKKNR